MIMNWFEKNGICRYEADEYVILYSPVARKYVVACQEHIDDFLACSKHAEVFTPLAEYIPVSRQPKVKAPEDYTLLTVLPNNVCNFNCSYCYSAAGRNHAVLDAVRLYRAMDFFMESKPVDFRKPLTISFMGGGEPLLSWELVRKGIEYAEAKAAERRQRLNVRIITNGSVLNDDVIAFLKAHRVEVSVSFELLEDIQNLQRKHYDLVRANICKLIAFGIPVQINSTITPANVGMMLEMLDVLVRDFPEVRTAMFEPVTAQDLFPTPSHLKVFYEEYVKNFVAVREKGDESGVDITSFAYLRTVFPLDRACPGEFCITAEGFITGCYCVATRNEPLSGQTFYGIASERGVEFDMERFERLLGHNVYSKEMCASCEVKWNCGGGCFHQFHTYDVEYLDEVCGFTRNFIGSLVRYKVRKQLAGHAFQLPALLTEQF